MFGSFASLLGYEKPETVTVSQILIHPIKSCKGTPVSAARCNREGLQYDREFMIVDESTHKCITARECPQMVLIHPQVFLDPASPDGGQLRVSFPADSGVESFIVPLRPSMETASRWERHSDIEIWSNITDGYICQSNSPTAAAPSALLSSYMSRAVHLIYKGPLPRPVNPTSSVPDLKGVAAFQDGYPLMILSEESIASVMERVRQAARQDEGWAVAGLDEDKWAKDEGTWRFAERFRPNIIVQGARMPFDEDSWEELVLENPDGSKGGELLLVSRCARCLLPNVDPLLGIADKAVPFKVISKYRRVEPDNPYSPCVGVNAVLQSEAFDLHVGDKLRVVKRLQRGTLPMAGKTA